MSWPVPTLAQIGEWGFAAICEDKEKRAEAVKRLTFAYYTQQEVIANLKNERDEARRELDSLKYASRQLTVVK